MDNIELQLLKLKIPINTFINCGTFIELKYNEQNIGTVPCYRTPGNLIIDTKSPEVLGKLRWDFIYDSNQDELNGLVADHFKIKVDDLEITKGNFRNLYVRDSDRNLVATVECSYEEGQWRVSNLEE